MRAYLVENLICYFPSLNNTFLGQYYPWCPILLLEYMQAVGFGIYKTEKIYVD